MNKKGNLESLAPIILTIIIIGFLVGVGIYVTSQVQTKALLQTSNSIDSNETLNASKQKANSTYLVPSANTSSLLSVTAVCLTNASCIDAQTLEGANCVCLNSGNYTIGIGSNYNFTLNESSKFASKSINLTYTYSFYDYSNGYQALGNVSKGIGDLSSWIGIIVVVIAASLIIGIVMKMSERM